MADTAGALDLCCFAYLSLARRPDVAPILVSNYPSKWTSYYLRMRYERLDPVIARALKEPDPFSWGIGVGSGGTASTQKLFEEAAGFGIRRGFTIPVHDSNGAVAAVTFATDEKRSSFERTIEAHRGVLQLMAMYFHAHASRKLAPNCCFHGISLSPREIECLKWAAEGKSAWDTSRIMGISRHTVAFHLDNAKAKLGVRSTIQAVVRFATFIHCP